MAFKAPLRHMEKLAQEQRFPSPRAALPSCCSLLIRKVLQSSGDPFQDIWGGGGALMAAEPTPPYTHTEVLLCAPK